MSNQIKLYHYWRSSCSWRVRWALELKNITYQSIAINLINQEQTSAEYLKKSPTGLVPCIEFNGEFLTESIAIIEWLDEVYPRNPLLPQNFWDRAKVRELVGFIASDTQPVQNLRVMQRHTSDQKERNAWAQWAISAGLAAVEEKLKTSAGTYSIGSQISLADVCLVPQVYNAKRFQVDMNNFPICERIFQYCLKLPSCDRAAPHNQEGATP